MQSVDVMHHVDHVPFNSSCMHADTLQCLATCRVPGSTPDKIRIGGLALASLLFVRWTSPLKPILVDFKIDERRPACMSGILSLPRRQVGTKLGPSWG